MNIRVLLDQNVPVQVRDFVRIHKSDWTVQHVYDVGLRGASDETIFQWCQQRNAIVVTFDEDFADARMYPVGTHAGVIRLRVWPTTAESTESALTRLFESVPDSDLPQSVIIIDPNRIRVRRQSKHG